MDANNALPSGTQGNSPHSFVVATLLCFFLGVIGIHRFYVGKVGTGILQIMTVGGLGFWVLYDLIILILGRFTDKNGLLVKQN
jgi:TM2 domain-containing membrane protein YozV